MIWSTSGSSISPTTGFPVREKHIFITMQTFPEADMSRKAVIRFGSERRANKVQSNLVSQAYRRNFAFSFGIRNFYSLSKWQGDGWF